jgi:hypothetical protein
MLSRSNRRLAGFDFTVAIATIHWFIAAGFKGYLSILTALSALYREHLPLASIAAVSITLCFSCLATGGTALGLIGIALGLEKLLLFSAEGEGSSAIDTLE